MNIDLIIEQINNDIISMHNNHFMGDNDNNGDLATNALIDDNLTTNALIDDNNGDLTTNTVNNDNSTTNALIDDNLTTNTFNNDNLTTNTFNDNNTTNNNTPNALSTNILSVSSNNTTAEFEVRFGKSNSQKFNPILCKNTWKQIFRNIMTDNSNIKKTYIFDYIYGNYNNKSPKLIEQFKSCSKTQHYQNTNAYLDDIFEQYKETTNTNYYYVNLAKKQYYSKQTNNMFTIDNIRYNYNNETYFKSKSKFYEQIKYDGLYLKMKRFKHRYSKKLNKYIRLDMTIIDVYNVTSHNNSIKQNTVEYMVELEMIHYNSKEHHLIINAWKNAIKRIYDSYFNLTHYLLHQAIIHPKTITNRDLAFIKEHRYTFTNKADGARMLLIFLNNQILLQNPVNQQTKSHIKNTTNINYTIIDGEYFSDTKQFLAFDLLFLGNAHNHTNKPTYVQKHTDNTNNVQNHTNNTIYNTNNTNNVQNHTNNPIYNTNYVQNHTNNPIYNPDLFIDVRQYNLTQRIQYLTTLKEELKLIKTIDVGIKKYYNLPLGANNNDKLGNNIDIFAESYKIWQNRDKLFKYSVDGLVFTPIEQRYIPTIQKLPTFKWKATNTIDVRVEYNETLDFTFFHHSTANAYSNDWGTASIGSTDINNATNGETNNNYMTTDKIKYLKWYTTDKLLSKEMNQAKMGIYKSINKCTSFFLGKFGKPHINIDDNTHNNNAANNTNNDSLCNTNNTHNNESIIIKNKNDIVEYCYDYEHKQWKFIKIRTNTRNKPNGYKTIKQNICAILHPITIENIKNFNNINEHNYDYITTYSIPKSSYFMHNRKLWRNFNNYVKKRLLGKTMQIIMNSTYNKFTNNNKYTKFANNRYTRINNNNKYTEFANNNNKYTEFANNNNKYTEFANNNNNNSNSISDSNNISNYDSNSINNHFTSNNINNGPNNNNTITTNHIIEYNRTNNSHNPPKNNNIHNTENLHSNNNIDNIQHNIHYSTAAPHNNEYYHLDVGCGKLGDLWKYIGLNYQNVLAIDISAKSIEEAQNRIISTGLFIKVGNTWQHQNGLKITLIRADMSLPLINNELFCAYINTLPKDWPGFNSISCMFSLHYIIGTVSKNRKNEEIWFKNTQKLNQFCTNIKLLLKPNGVFLGTYMNGNKIKTNNIIFQDKNTVLFRIERLVPKNTQNTDIITNIQDITQNNNQITDTTQNNDEITDTTQNNNQITDNDEIKQTTQNNNKIKNNDEITNTTQNNDEITNIMNNNDEINKNIQIPSFKIFNETWGTNVSMTEPEINDIFIQNLMKMMQLTKIEQNSFEHYFNDKLLNKMTKTEQKLCALNDTFIYQKV